jgi:hypothetical protein
MIPMICSVVQTCQYDTNYMDYIYIFNSTWKMKFLSHEDDGHLESCSDTGNRSNVYVKLYVSNVSE